MRRLVLLMVVVLSAPALAQRKASEIASVGQTVDGTRMSIEYYRPVARGRDSLFGKVVRWGSTWTPGANWATTLDVDKDVEVNGNLLSKGKYAIWTIPRESDDWTVIFHRKARAFHTERPNQKEEAFRFTVKAEQGAHMETLMWYFPVVGPDGATLRLHWGTTLVAMQVSVRPTVVAARLTTAERALYVGSYSYEADWVKSDGRMEVTDSAGRFIATLKVPAMTEDPTFDLIPLGDHRFRTGRTMGGQVVDLSDGSTVTFTLDGPAISGFEVRGSDGKAEARGTRRK